MSSVTSAMDPEFHSSLENFSHNIFTKLVETNGQTNVIFSPFSIQTCLAMVRLAADGQTAAEMDQGLSFAGQSAESVSENYHSILAKYENSNILKIANKVYVKQGRELHDKYKDILSAKFFSCPENIDFGQSKSAAGTINAWVESKTNNTIKNLVEPDTFSSDTRLFLLSAIHFKGSWETPFDVKKTTEQGFYTDETNSVKVQMMFRQGRAFLSYFSELDATAIRLPYQDSDLSMVILLPRSRTGLVAMEEKLKNVSLETLKNKMSSGSSVRLYLPKFKAKLGIKLKGILLKMGITKMFGPADFSQMLKHPEPLSVSEVIHKAFIEVNEEGTEAAAATGVEVMFRSGPRTFRADHPFYYLIMNEDAVPLFQGTFVGIKATNVK